MKGNKNVRIYRAVRFVNVQVIFHKDGSTEFVWPKKRKRARRRT